MADTTQLRMNVAALKRVDPYARDIVDSATHVALYTFEDNEWEKTSIEGALFVYSRNGEPYHSMVIMNRLNTNNLIEPVSQGLELQLQEPFLLYRNSKCQIYGIWFYDKDECIRVATTLTHLATGSIKSQTAADKSNAQPGTAGGRSGGVDIFSMLSKAQDEYNSGKGVATSKPEVPTPRAPDLPYQSVLDFFAKAGGGSAQLPAVTAPAAGALYSLPPPLQRLMSNPAHSVAHIEQQQRAVTPHEAEPSVFNGFKPDSLPKSDAIPIRSRDKNPRSGPDVNGIDNGIGFMRISSPKSNSPLASFLNRSGDVSRVPLPVDSVVGELRPVSAPGTHYLETPQKPALMPPTMFTAGALHTPERAAPRPEPLTRNQLLQAFNYLVKNDADFVNKLHEAYVKSFSELVS